MSHYRCLAQRLSIVLMICVGVTAVPLQAAVVVARSDEAMTRMAPAILTGTVVESYPRYNERGGIETVTRILVEESLKGNVAGGTIVDIVQFGGRLGGAFQAQSGAPRYEVGARYLVFLDHNGAGQWTTFDLALGQFRFVPRDGKQLLLRDTREISGWMETGEDFHDVDRSAAAFLSRVRELIKAASGVQAMGKQLQPVPQANDYDLKGMTQSAVGTWAGAESSMGDSASNTAAGSNSLDLADCESRIIPDDPGNNVSGTFNGGGVVAVAFYGCGGGPGNTACGGCPDNVKNGENYGSIMEADIVINDGVSTSTINSGNFTTVMVHEIGHTWGFRHSDKNAADNAACAAPLPCASSAIMNSVVVPGLNGSLQSWDLDAANEVYGNGTRQATLTGSKYVGDFGLPIRRPNGFSWRIATGPPCTPPGVPTVSANPTTITAGQFTQLSASATGTNPTFAWFTGSPGDTSTPVGNGATINVNPSVTTSYWVRATACTPPQSQNSATSVTVTVQQPQCVPTTQVTASSQQTSVTPGTLVTITANANGSNPSPTFQWFTGNPGSGTQINGATNSTLTATPAVTTTYYVQARNTCSTGPATSNAVTINVQPCTPASGVTVSALPTTILAGGTTQLSVSFNGTAPFTIQWFTGNPPGTPLVDATNRPSFNANPTVTTSYYAEVTTGCGPAFRSNVVTVTVAAQCTPPSNAVATATPASITTGQTSNLAVTASGTGVTFQWFTGASPNGTAIPGATSATLPVTPTATTTYYARATGACGTPVDSNPVTVTVAAACVNPTITTQPANQSIIVGTTATLSVSAAGTAPLTFQWFKGATDDTSNPQNGATSATFTTPALMTKTLYWVRVSGSCAGGSPVFSNTATVEVKAGRSRPVKH